MALFAQLWKLLLQIIHAMAVGVEEIDANGVIAPILELNAEHFHALIDRKPTVQVRHVTHRAPPYPGRAFAKHCS